MLHRSHILLTPDSPFTSNNAQNTAIAVVASSRLVFAVARDGVLPFSGWVSEVRNGQPRNAVLVIWLVASIVTCTILPSSVAFTSLISAAGVPSAAAYGLICFGRFFLTSRSMKNARWSLGRWSRPMQFAGIFWNGWVVAVLFSPFEWPVTATTLNCKLDLALRSGSGRGVEKI
jgi:amino acid transporter